MCEKLMNFTSKSRYALKILMDLAHHSDLPHVHRLDIAERHGIPSNYLDQIMLRLKKGGLVESVRGRGGGYHLGRGLAAISVWDIFSAVEDSVYPVKCLGKPEIPGNQACGLESTCVSHGVWTDIFEAFKEPLMRLTLDTLVQRWPAASLDHWPKPPVDDFGHSIFACEPGRNAPSTQHLHSTAAAE